jgi:hypothetical protein
MRTISHNMLMFKIEQCLINGHVAKVKVYVDYFIKFYLVA